MVYESKLRIVRNGGSNMIDTGQLYASSSPLCSTWFNRFSWLKYGFLIYLIVCSTSIRACLRGGLGLECLRVGLLGSWLGWLRGGVRLRALCLFLEWWNRPFFISPTARTGLLDYSRIVWRDSSPGNRPISTSRCWVEYRFDMELEGFCCDKIVKKLGF